MKDLALLYRSQGRYAQAEPMFIEVLAAQQRVLGAEHPKRLACINDLAFLYLNQKQVFAGRDAAPRGTQQF